MLRKSAVLKSGVSMFLLLIATLVCANPVSAADPLEVTVESSQSGALSGVKVYGFTESGAYTGKNATTDRAGVALFDKADFGDGMYRFRIDYLGQQFWSVLVELPEESSVLVVIEEETVSVTVTDSVDPIVGIRVYLFSAAGAYLGVYADTDAGGDVFFDLPLDTTFKFRADTLGYQFWSEEIPVQTGTQVDFLIEHRNVEITVETVFDGTYEPIEAVPVYLFTASGSYLGVHQSTNVAGRVTFHVPEMPYKVRADYLSQQCWSNEFTWQDTAVPLEMADAQITVTGSGQPLGGVTVYVFSASGSYLGLSDPTDSSGQVLFRLPAATYNFRADYQGSRYWSGVKDLTAHVANEVQISTGGGTFVLTVLKAPSDPLPGVNCYVFSEGGSYLGLSGTTDPNGEVGFGLADGRYKLRTDYLGYQFWSDVFEVPNTLSDTLLIAHADVIITVQGMFQGIPELLEGVRVYLFTPDDAYLGQSQVTDGNGQVTFYLPDLPYKVRADYLSQQFWSDEFTWQETSVVIPMADAQVSVTSSTSTLEGVNVYVFSAAGSYLGVSGVTDIDGQVSFRVPGGAYKFRADYLGSQYWSGIETLEADLVNPVSISTGGGTFTFTVLKGETDPLVGVTCYVFNEGGAYLGINAVTDGNGQVMFELSEGHYKFRTDYLGYQFWSPVYDVPETLFEVFTIPHQEVTISVEGVYGTSEPIEGVNVHLFTPAGSYLGQFQVTDTDGQVVLFLPDRPYKVRVDYLGQQFWSDEFQSQNTIVSINEGLADIHVHLSGVHVVGANVYLFSEAGSYLGWFETTDESGKVEFLLPDRPYRFRVDEGGNQYWSPAIEITAGIVNPVEIDLSPTTVTISADPETIPVGGTATLTWSSTNAYACEITPEIGIVDVNGSIEVSPSETTVYTVTATGPPGTTSDTVQVVVTAEITVPEDVDYALSLDEQEGGGGLVGETVRIFNGNVVERRSDLTFPSPNRMGLSFEASYNSRAATSGTLGSGWTHSYEASLDPDYELIGVTYLRVLGPGGRVFYFQEETAGVYKGAFHERSHVEAKADGYVWYRLNGTRYGFSSEGRLLWIDDEIGNRLELGYAANSRLVTVTDTASSRVFTFNYNGNGFFESISGPVTAAVSDGVWVSYGYDVNQNLISVTYADGSGFDYGYADPNDVHNLTEKRDKLNHLLNSWSYDMDDRCVDNFSVEGKGVGIVYTDSTQVQVTDAYGTKRTYSIGEIGGRKRATAMQGSANAPYSESNAIWWVYDDQMRLIEVEYARDTITQYQGYDERGNPQTVKLAAGTPDERVVYHTYHPDMNLPLTRTEASVLQAGGNKVTIWDYDNEGNSTPNENPTGLVYRIVEQGFSKDTGGTTVPYEYVTTFSYDDNGQLLGIDGPLAGTGDTTSFTYDPTTGDLLSLTRPHIGTTTLDTYDAAGQVRRITDVNGQSESFSYDGRGRVTAITHQADGSTRSNTYNTAGLLESTTDEDGVNRSYEYDAAYGRLSRIFDHDGNYIAYTYDSQGNRIEMSKHDATGSRTSRKRWDYQHPVIPGKLWKEINADDTYMDYSYDSSGNVSAVTDYNRHTTDYGYDVLNRLIMVTQPGSVITAYAYDRHGNLISVTDAEGHQTTYTYDDMGRLVSTTSPDTGTVSYAYDAAGNLTEKADAKGFTATYDYDLLSRLTAVHFPNTAEDITYAYDEGSYGKGRRTGMTDPTGTTAFTYDSRGRLVGKTGIVNGVSYPITRSYTVGGRLTSMVYPTGRSLTYARYPNGKMQGVTTTFDFATTMLVDNIAYKPFGKPTGMGTGAGGMVNNQSSECDCLEVANPGEQMEQVYTYDSNRNLTSIRGTNTLWFNQDFSYDSLNRLISATGAYGTINYTYDKVGNRLTRTVDGQTDNYTYVTGSNKLQEITGVNPATFSYDPNGNITGMGIKTFVYNQNNRLVRVEEGSNVLGEYRYNGLGQRITKMVNGVTTIFHYDFDGQIIGESLPDGTFISEYLYLGSSRTAKVDVSTRSIYYYLNNYLGTPVLMTDDDGTVVWEAEYKPFGQAEVNLQASVVNNFRFPGQYYDQEIELHYNYHRYYDPRMGRYLMPDLVGLLGGVNLFLYVNNNPINQIDILGLDKGFHYRAYRDRARNLKKWKGKGIESPENFMERARRKNAPDKNPLLELSKSMSATGGPPPGLNIKCETSFSECFGRCNTFFSIPPCEDPSGYTGILTVLTLAGCATTCAITPCTYDDPVFDPPPPWW